MPVSKRKTPDRWADAMFLENERSFERKGQHLTRLERLMHAQTRVLNRKGYVSMPAPTDVCLLVNWLARQVQQKEHAHKSFVTDVHSAHPTSR